MQPFFILGFVKHFRMMELTWGVKIVLISKFFGDKTHNKMSNFKSLKNLKTLSNPKKYKKKPI